MRYSPLVGRIPINIGSAPRLAEDVACIRCRFPPPAPAIKPKGVRSISNLIGRLCFWASAETNAPCYPLIAFHAANKTLAVMIDLDKQKVTAVAEFRHGRCEMPRLSCRG